MEGPMRKYFVGAIFLSLIFAHFNPGIARVMFDTAKMHQYAPGEILVKFKRTASKSDIVQLNTTLGAKTIKEFPSIGVRHIKLKSGEKVPEAIKKYSSDPNVEYAEPNYKLTVCQTFPVPFDPSFGELWGLNNTGQAVDGTTGTPDADIDAPEAWDITTGSANIVIAVIDTGVNYNHTDLAANMWTNPGEDPWADPADPTTGNGIDDDGNGYTDDWRGWDFLGHETHVPPMRAPDNDPMDQSDHGTHVAGTIAAVGSNGNGIAGVMWTASIIPLRFIDGQGGWTSDAINAINYAASMGAHIINASWGGYFYSQALYDAIANSGVLFIAAAGNEGYDNDGDNKLYPASYDLPNIISVAATDQDDLLADFSNYGATSVDVGAPGTNIYSSILARNPVPLFSDNMEAGDGNWVHDAMDPTKDTWVITNTGPPASPPDYYGPPYSHSGAWSFTDSPYDAVNDDWNYESDTDSWIGLFSGINPVGQFGTKLTFWVRLDLHPT
jgi:subtilisin family serine protease